MAKTASILTEEDWKRSFGELLNLIADEQGISADEIGRRLDRMPGTTGHNRAGDWSRYVNAGRIPTEFQLGPLASVLKMPLPVLRLCAGYVDDIFECSYSLVSAGSSPSRKLPCSKRRAVFAFLFSLFPSDGMHTGNLCELWSFILGRPVRLNLTAEEGFLTGHQWNSTWLYPPRFRSSDLIERRCDPAKDGVTYVSVSGPRRTKPWVEYAVRAKIQTDIGSPLAATILASERIMIPKTDSLCEAQKIMHAKALRLTLRADLATTIVHDWADGIDKKIADEVRRDLNCHDQKTITSAAASWIKGKRKDRPDHKEFWW